MLKRSEQAALIAKIPLFTGLPHSELEHLTETLQPCVFEAGALLIREGEADEHFYILLEGEAEVIKALGTTDERQLAIRPAGTLFGEMSLFDPQGRHTASVRARSSISTLEMTCQDFDRLLHRYPILAYDMVRQLSQRLGETEKAHTL